MMSERKVMSATDSQDTKKEGSLATYSTPRLVRFGSVIELTAGCPGSGSDSGGPGNSAPYGPGGSCGTT